MAEGYQNNLNSPGGLRIITDVAQIGLSGTPTLKSIVTAMPNISMALFTNNQIDQSDMSTTSLGGPANVVIIFRLLNNRIFAFGARTFGNISDASSKLAFATWDETNWHGWFELAKA